MSQVALLRNGLNLAKKNAPTSILKRPQSPTPFPFHATFSILVSPQSPHVQFPSTPHLTAMYTTHSSEVYDRAPIKVSPNPLVMPPRGDRYHSPTIESFTLTAPPKSRKGKSKVETGPRARLNDTLVLQLSDPIASPAITDFEDPRSPKPRPKQGGPSRQARQERPQSLAPPQEQEHIRFAATPVVHHLSSYPRSPYPSAPLGSPVPEGAAARLQQRPSRKNSDMLRVSSPITFSFVTPPETSGAQTTVPKVKSGLNRRNKPAPLDLSPPAQPQAPPKAEVTKQDSSESNQLVNAFWDSVTLEETPPMVTALEYPASAMSGLVDIPLMSAAPGGASLVFGTQDGSIWSPAPPAPASAVPNLSLKNTSRPVPARESLLRAALMSPGINSSFGARPMSTRAASNLRQVPRSLVASPSPHDPSASFPSFAAAMAMAGPGVPHSVDPVDAMIAYPPPVATAV